MIEKQKQLIVKVNGEQIIHQQTESIASISRTKNDAQQQRTYEKKAKQICVPYHSLPSLMPDCIHV
jgi:hypothetical protein